MEKKPENKMEYRFLGNTGVMVSAISLGTMNMNEHDKTDHYFEIIKKAYDLGINTFDTAELYGKESSAEIIFGKCLKKLDVAREDLVLTVKVYWGPDRFEPMAKNSVGLSRKHIIEGVRNSLKRLGCDYADVVFAHRPDNDTPMEEQCRAFDWLIRKGYALYWATSEWSAYQIEKAIGICKKLKLHAPIAD
jgi:aryl-alcohol dehydrogenase-like predicted oxidoreductase